MPIAKFQMPDGRVARFEVPDGTSPEQAQSMMEAHFAQPSAPVAAPKEQSWGDVAGSALANAIPSTGKMIGGVVDAAMHPLDTASNVLRLGVGGAMKALPQGAQDWIVKNSNDPEKVKQTLDMVGATGDFYKQRYGSVEGFKQALATDPAGIAADAATLLSGGAGLASKAGMVKTASALSKGASAVDPLANTLRAGSAVASGTGKVAKNVLGATTGAGSQAIEEAYKAGSTGGKTSELFAENMRGNAPMTDVLDAAKANLAEMNKAKSAEYRANMAAIKTDKTALSFDGVDDALKNAYETVTFKGQVKNEKAAEALTKISDTIGDWKNLDPAEFHTPEGLDALKQKVGAIVDSIPFEEKTARMVGQNMYNSIKSEITKQAPTYAKTMKEYSDATEQIREIERALSLGQKASVDTSMRKLQSLMRNNVNTNYGNRAALAQQLEKVGGNEIMPQLAGQALNSWTPRGLQGLGATGVASAGVISMNPMALPVLTTQSPRLAGEASLKAGQIAGALRKGKEFAGGVSEGAVNELAKQLKISPAKLKADPRLLANILYQMNQPKEQTQQ